MFNLIQKYFEKAETTEEAPDNQKILTAACALFLEVANSDDEFSETEKESIISILKEDFDLPPESVTELLQIAEAERKEQIDLYHFAKLIKENYSHDEKLLVIEALWKVIYADGRVDQFEDRMIKTLADLIGIRRNELIDAKIRIKESLSG